MGQNKGTVGAASRRRDAARWLLVLIALVVIVVMVALWVVIWKVLGVRTNSAGELASQGQLLVSLIGLVLTVVLVTCTLYYAWQSRALVLESRLMRTSQEQATSHAAETTRLRQLQGATAALHGAGLDFLQTALWLAVHRRYRGLWRTRQGEPVFTALGALSKAVHELRYIAPDEILAIANDLHAQALDAFGTLTSRQHRPAQAKVQKMAERLGDLADAAAALSSQEAD